MFVSVVSATVTVTIDAIVGRPTAAGARIKEHGASSVEHTFVALVRVGRPDTPIRLVVIASVVVI